MKLKMKLMVNLVNFKNKGRQKGSALVWIMALIMMFSILAFSVGDFFINSSKINGIYEENEELEQAVKSAIEIGKYFILNDKGYLKFDKNTEEISIPNDYIMDKLKNTEELKYYKYKIDCYSYDRESEEKTNIYTIEVKVKSDNKEYNERYKIEYNKN